MNADLPDAPDTPDPRALRRFRNRAADRYDEATVLLNEVAGRMFARLDLVRLPPGPILDLGCATGLWSARLQERYPDADVFGLDVAEALLARARARAAEGRSWLARFARPPTRHACAEFDRLPWRPGTFSMIWSTLAAQWFRDPPAAWRQIGSLLRPGGLLAFSTLGPDTFRELQRAWIKSGRPPATLPFADMHDVGDALLGAGFADPVMDVDVLQLTYPSVDAMVRDARDLGAQNVLSRRPRGLLSPRQWRSVCNTFDEIGENAKIAMTVEVIYGHAWRPEHGPKRTAEGLDVIRVHRRGGA